MAQSLNTTPWIVTVKPEITQPNLGDNTADVDRLLRGIAKKLSTEHININTDFALVKTLPFSLRKYSYNVHAMLFEDHKGWHLIDIVPSRNTVGTYGLAIDLGTSTVVAQLFDLEKNEIMGEVSFHNPQLKIGADILTRIHFAEQEQGLLELQTLLIDKLNAEVYQLASRYKIGSGSIAGVSVAGNTTMTHLFLGLNPCWIYREPYIPVINTPDILRSADLGLAVNPGAPVLVFPNVGSYLGGDLIAGILASGMTQEEEISFLVDVGTNAEVVIGNRDWLMGCAGAAGPALEGGVADMGMIAGPGVIDRITIDPSTSEFRIRTIANQPPVGICGSGLIDLIAQLFSAGMIDLTGKFLPETCGERLVDIDGIRHLIIVSATDSGTGCPLTLGQPDIDRLIRSKAAMYTILTTMSNTVNIPMNEISRFYVAGTFGSYIDPRSAITIGMIPDLPLQAYVNLGNTSLKGAGMALVSAEAREEMLRIRDRVTYLELNVNQEFMNLFSAAKFIPHTDRSLFPSLTTG